jgi:hypothetical protein
LVQVSPQQLKLALHLGLAVGKSTLGHLRVACVIAPRLQRLGAHQEILMPVKTSALRIYKQLNRNVKALLAHFKQRH